MHQEALYITTRYEFRVNLHSVIAWTLWSKHTLYFQFKLLHQVTHKHIAHKRTHNNLAEVLSCVLNTYLCSDMIKTSCRLVVTAQPNRLVILAKCSGVLFQTKWFRIQVSLKSIKFKISRLFWVKRSLTFKIITKCRFTLNAYVTW